MHGVAHPYQPFYFLWRLSYLFGREYAHHSLTYEVLVGEPEPTISGLLQAVGVTGYDVGRRRALVNRPVQGKWRQYVDDTWFKRHETFCENMLGEFLQPQG